MRLIIAAVGRLKDGAERELLREAIATGSQAWASGSAFGPVAWHEPGESRPARQPSVAPRKGPRS